MKVSILFDQRVFRDFRLFVVPALIENQGRSLYLPMIIDSGASYLTVRPDVFDQLGITPVREAPLVTASERAVAPLGQVDKVTVGSRCFAVNVEMISIPFPEDLPAEGLLGASFLRHFLVSMDYEKGKLELTTRWSLERRGYRSSVIAEVVKMPVEDWAPCIELCKFTLAGIESNRRSIQYAD